MLGGCCLMVMKIKRVHSLVKVNLHMEFEFANGCQVIGRQHMDKRSTDIMAYFWDNGVYFLNNSHS